MGAHTTEHHELEYLLLSDLYQKHIPSTEHCYYYTHLTGLRLRIFEGIATNFLEYKKVTHVTEGPIKKDLAKLHKCDGLNKKITLIQNFVMINSHEKSNIDRILGILHKIRNPILHGDFEFQISRAIWEKLESFLSRCEFHLESLVTDQPDELSFPEAGKLKIELDSLFSA